MIIAMVAGILTNIFDKDEIIEEVSVQKPSFSALAPQKTNTFSLGTAKKEEEKLWYGDRVMLQ